ncbi:hypothetical protein [Streptomyces sp. CB03238]|uniref:hypothetical protein n=1 Tax=Streptomyces sp. CB03238 TaxID=1907777 RepID=UPI000A112CD3|nr:hypothetical protein [Streptomyces sp. CB03238]ORT58183.1 hypothetical protein BKD26_19975 [Streptomyces sp. CB03238]
MAIHIAVAGAGPVDKSTVTELLDDWLGIDANGKPTTDEEVFLVLPAAAEHVTPAVKAVYNWSGEVDPEIPYTAVVAQTLDKASKVIRDNAESAEPARDGEVYTVLGRTLADRLTGDRFLLVAGGQDDEDLADLVGYCHDEDITVLDLRDALKQITPPEPEADNAEESADQVDEKPAPEEEAEADEEPCEGGTQTLVPLPQPQPAATLEDEVAAAHHRITAADPKGIQGVIAVLEDVTHHLRLVDESNAAANLAAPRYRPITERSIQGLEWAKALQYDGLKPVTSAAEPEEPQPAKRSSGKVRKEWFNPETERWEPLRGRPRKGVEIRPVAA